jgi:hypothetical protein
MVSHCAKRQPSISKNPRRWSTGVKERRGRVSVFAAFLGAVYGHSYPILSVATLRLYRLKRLIASKRRNILITIGWKEPFLIG